MAGRWRWGGALVAVLGVLVAGAVWVRSQGDDASTPGCADLIALNVGSDGESVVTLIGGDQGPRTITDADWYATKPRFSPDGRTLVVVRAGEAYESAGPGSTELWLIGTDGSGARRLVDQAAGGGDDGADDDDLVHHDDPDWSPDGRTIVFSRWSGGAAGAHLESAAADGGRATVLTDPGVDRDRLPVFSPDSARLAFVRDPDGEDPPGLWVAAADGSGARRVAELPSSTGSLAWTPDGASILVGRSASGDDRTLQLVSVRTGKATELDAEGALATWVPGTDRLHYLTPEGLAGNGYRTAEGRLVDGQLVARDRFTGGGVGHLYPYIGLDAAGCPP